MYVYDDRAVYECEYEYEYDREECRGEQCLCPLADRPGECMILETEAPIVHPRAEVQECNRSGRSM